MPVRRLLTTRPVAAAARLASTPRAGIVAPATTGAMKARSTAQKLVWAILMTGLAGLLYLAFRGYLAPALLLDFANGMLC